jgi:hypothetical protein
MADSTEFLGARRRTWRQYVGFTLAGLVVVALLVGAWMFYAGISASLQAEENLHATLFTIRLVEQYVHEYGRWPQSWREIEQMPFRGEAPSPLNNKLNVIRIGGSHGYDWPAQSAHIRERVIIDFAANTTVIMNAAPTQFQAIRPDGPCYEYRDYGFVESLQETLRRAQQSPSDQ